MDFQTALFGFLGVIVGSGITLLAEWLRSRAQSQQQREERAHRRTETLAELYTDFMVTFHNALHLNELYYEGHRVRLERGWDHKETPERLSARLDAERRFREAAWRVRVHERDALQIMALEALAQEFDADVADFDDRDAIASSYHSRATALRANASQIITNFQTRHAEQLGLLV